MNKPIKEMVKEGLSIKIYHDEDPQNPRTEWDNLGTMVCFHRRYNLGDSNHGFDSVEDAVAYEKSNRAAALLPLYLMDHSGLCMTVDREYFRAADPQGWDWGKVGFIYVDAKKLKAEGITEEKAIDILKSEVNTYDMYLRGEVYGYVIETPTGETIDSCWGYFGMTDVEEAINEVLSSRKAAV